MAMQQSTGSYRQLGPAALVEKSPGLVAKGERLARIMSAVESKSVNPIAKHEVLVAIDKLLDACATVERHARALDANPKKGGTMAALIAAFTSLDGARAKVAREREIVFDENRASRVFFPLNWCDEGFT